MRGGGKNSPSWRCGGASRGCLSTRGKEVGQRMLRAREGARPGGGRAQGRQTLFACRRGNIVNARAFGGQFWASQSTLRASPWVSNDMAAQAHPAFPQVAAPCTHSACETSLAAQGAEVASSKGAKCAARRRRSVVPRGKGRRRGERGRRERRETLMARVCVGGQCGVDVDKNHSGVFVSLLMCPSCTAGSCSSDHPQSNTFCRFHAAPPLLEPACTRTRPGYWKPRYLLSCKRESAVAQQRRAGARLKNILGQTLRPAHLPVCLTVSQRCPRAPS